MRVCEVENVDVVAHACAITCIVIRSKNLEAFTATKCCFQRQGYGMGFGRVPLPNTALKIGTGRIEVA
ncbi:hypothetical protein D3C80_1734810 [compost metagenome]